MGDAPDIHALSGRLAVLEERMKTMHAEYEGALDRLRADMAAHREDAARRETRIILAMIAVVAIGFTVFGFVTAPH